MCSRNFLLHNCNRNSHLLNCNRKIHQHTSTKKYHLKTCINATDVVTCIIAIEKVSCIVPTETSTCRIDYRNFNFQKWCQSEIHLVTIKKLSKWVSTKFKANSFSTPCIPYWRNSTVDCVNEWIVLYIYIYIYIYIISIFNFLIFIHFTNQITLKPSLAQKLKLICKFSTI